MGIDISAIKPNVISRNVKGYSFLIYGGPKVGKTTFATRFPKHLLLGFEKGYSALPGVMAVPINNWAEFLSVLNQLKADNKKAEVAKVKGEVYERMYETIVIDIADIAYDYCEKYILAQNSVSKVADIPFGAGYGLIEKEFDSALRSIIQMGYGLILISHESQTKSEEEKTTYSTCSLSKRPKKVCTRLVDVYGYATVEMTSEGAIHNLHVRATPEWDAGTRFKYLEETIPLNYNSVYDAIQEAITKAEKELGINGSDFVTEEVVNNYVEDEKPSYEAIMESINSLISSIMEKGSVDNTIDIKQKTIASIVSKYLGENNKLMNATPSQIEQLILIEMELREV